MDHRKGRSSSFSPLSVSLLFSGALFLFAQNGQAQPETKKQNEKHYENLVRIPIGVSFYNSGWYNCVYVYPYYACGSGNYNDYIPFNSGLQVEIHLSEGHYLTPGFNFMTGSVSASYFNGYEVINSSNHVNLWEPTLDYVAKGSSDSYSDSEKILGRLRVGLGGYLGSDGHTGGTFRIGGGGSLYNGRKLGLGLDLVIEAGSYHGYWIGGIQLLISPEFRF
jgi:hypothetical protein